MKTVSSPGKITVGIIVFPKLVEIIARLSADWVLVKVSIRLQSFTPTKIVQSLA